MDINNFKKHAILQIEVGKMVNIVREAIEEEKHKKQDQYEGESQKCKPLLDKQGKVEENINKRQDNLIEQLRSNQLAITGGLKNLIDSNHNMIAFNQELPVAIEGPEEEEKRTDNVRYR